MSGESKELELLPISRRFIEEGGFRGRLARRDVMSYDDVIQEVIKNNFLRMEPHTLKMILEETFETMIAGTLRDGKTRRLGDYFMLQMEVHGKFDEQGDQFDPSKHKLALKLRPLKAFRRKPGRGDVTVYNRNAGPKVVISGVTSASSGRMGVVNFGEDIIVTGENLWVVSRAGEAVQDKITINYRSQCANGGRQFGDWDVTVNEAGTQMIINWERTVGEIIRINPEKLDPAKSRPLGVMVAIRSRGGSEESKQQLHRGKAYFDRWLEKYPHYEGHFEKIDWGRV